MSSNDKEYVKLDSSDVEFMLREICSIIFSLDRLGSSFDYSSEREQALEAIYNYLTDKEIEIFAKLSRMRRILSSCFSDELPDDKEESQLGKIMSDVPYWTRLEYDKKQKKGKQKVRKKNGKNKKGKGQGKK